MLLQTLENQAASNVRDRYRLEKTSMTGGEFFLSWIQNPASSSSGAFGILRSGNVSLFKVISTTLEADDRIFGVSGKMEKTNMGFLT